LFKFLLFLFVYKEKHMKNIFIAWCFFLCATPCFSQGIGGGLDEYSRNRDAADSRARQDEYERRERADERRQARQAEESRRRQQEQDLLHDNSFRNRNQREMCRSRGYLDCN
jgi:hypothetical protein